VHWLYKLHIFLGLLITILFPFTRLVHIISGFAAPVRYLLTRPGYQIVRSRRRTALPYRSGPVAVPQAASRPDAAVGRPESSIANPAE